jgi:hypothetical protein
MSDASREDPRDDALNASPIDWKSTRCSPSLPHPVVDVARGEHFFSVFPVTLGCLRRIVFLSCSRAVLRVRFF